MAQSASRGKFPPTFVSLPGSSPILTKSWLRTSNRSIVYSNGYQQLLIEDEAKLNTELAEWEELVSSIRRAAMLR
jgi:hypothetical protein